MATSLGQCETMSDPRQRPASGPSRTLQPLQPWLVCWATLREEGPLPPSHSSDWVWSILSQPWALTSPRPLALSPSVSASTPALLLVLHKGRPLIPTLSFPAQGPRCHRRPPCSPLRWGDATICLLKGHHPSWDLQLGPSAQSPGS